MVLCPKCKKSMQQRQGTGHYGAKLPLSQCPECSGLWIDGRVVRGVSYESALEAESDVDFGEIVTEPRKTELVCPRCESNLMEQTGKGLPKDLHIDYCEVCEGYWFDKGELMVYKTYLEKKRRNLRQSQEKARREQERTGAGQSKPQPTRHWRDAGGRTVIGVARALTSLL
jgi:Zn-finger nucleic acid-binding protein